MGKFVLGRRCFNGAEKLASENAALAVAVRCLRYDAAGTQPSSWQATVQESIWLLPDSLRYTSPSDQRVAELFLRLSALTSVRAGASPGCSGHVLRKNFRRRAQSAPTKNALLRRAAAVRVCRTEAESAQAPAWRASSLSSAPWLRPSAASIAQPYISVRESRLSAPADAGLRWLRDRGLPEPQVLQGSVWRLTSCLF